MNKEKTAMQMLIEAMQKDYDGIDGSLSFTSNVQKGEIRIRIQQAKRLLQKEQEQIEKAFTYGCFFHDENKKQSAKEYYKSKYGGEDVD